MAIDGTPSPILSVGTADVDDVSEARRVSHENAYELSKGTLAFDVTPDSASGRQGLFSKDAEFFGEGGHFTVWIEDGRITARLQSEDRSYELHGGSIEAGETAAVAVTFGPSGFKLFVDGETVDQSGYEGGLQHNNEPIVIGASAWGSGDGTAAQLTHEFKGTISNLELYDEVFSADAIREGVNSSQASENAPSGLPDPLFSVNSAAVDGLSDASRFSHESGYELSNGTLAFDVTPDSASGRQGLFSKDAEFFGDGGHFTVWIEDGRITARLQSEDRSYEIGGGSVKAGETTSVAVSFGDGGFKLFIDGEQVDQNGYTGGLQSNNEPIVVGASAWGSGNEAAAQLTHEFKGEISNLGLYETALTEADIRSLADPSEGSTEEPTEAPTEEPEAPNSAPILDDAKISRAVTEGELDGFALESVFSDPDGDEMQFILRDAPDFASFTDGNRLRLAPGDDDAGTYSFSVAASDGAATSADFDVTVNVREGSSDGGGSAGGNSGGNATDGNGNSGGNETGGGGSDGGNSSGNETDGGGNSGGGSGYTPEKVSLTASVGSVNSDKTGAQEWNKGVVLSGYDLNGNLAKVGITNQWDDVGFGVQGNGSRWQDQIDYYASGGGRSEKLVVDFNGDVTDVVARIGMLGATEGPNNTPETGIWKAYDGNGNLVDRGEIGPKYSTLGNGVKENGSYGLFPIAIDADEPFERLEFEATQFDYGNGSSNTRDYGENSSDYNLVGLDFLRLEPTDDILV